MGGISELFIIYALVEGAAELEQLLITSLYAAVLESFMNG